MGNPGTRLFQTGTVLITDVEIGTGAWGLAQAVLEDALRLLLLLVVRLPVMLVVFNLADNISG